ncbi:MAG TPA: hypothetical protein DCQ93_05360 [Bacteroidetes bacterium]|nr:hypothetical protein [Bacteroidota bacterium]
MLSIFNLKSLPAKSRNAGKKIFFTSSTIILFLIFQSCGQKNNSNVKLTPEMENFMSMLDGKYQSVDAAIQKYRSSDTLRTQDMDIKDLQNPEVQDGRTDGKQTCYDLKVNDKAKDCVYELCWENGKIISITDKTE